MSGNDSRDLDDLQEVPVYADRGTGSSNSSDIVAKAVTGQRFVCTQRTDDGWYRIHLTNGTDTTTGWISGDHVYIYNESAAELLGIGSWELY